jgi:molybdopterin molybdotransferase
VAILATGDELVDVGATPLLHQIRNSNSYSLAAQVRQAGGEAVILPVAHDSVESLRQSAREALKYDLLILSGGVSKGRYDFVKPVMASLGAEFLMTGAEIQPGKPVVFGRVAKASAAKHFFGLPGNPVSTLVTFALFVRPLLAALGGESGWSPRFVDARLARAFTTKTGLTRFLPCVLRNAGIETPEAEPVTWQGSGDLAATSHANAFFVVPPDREKIEAGERIHVLVE